MSLTTPADGMTISRDTTLRPGVYLLPNGLHITRSGVTLDGNGAVLIGAGRQGVGIRLVGVRDVTVRNVQLSDYYHAIHAADCAGLTVTGCRVRNTAEVAANSDFLDIWRSAESPYGGAVCLVRVSDSRIHANDLQHQMAGLLAYHCRALDVRANNAGYCSGFGFHLYETCASTYADNWADYCCRYQPRGADHGHLGADAAGFLIVYNSCENVFRRNRARLGGDGFFLAGLTPQGEHAGCDDNLFEDNDGSYSPNIAFEGTFSRGNVYRGNVASHCNYGFWLGFSAESTLEHNTIAHNRQAGIAVENGVGMIVRHNRLRRNGHGVLLWSRHVPFFARAVPDNDTSRGWHIEDNDFRHNTVGVRIAAQQDHGIRDQPPDAPAAPWPRDHVIAGNRFADCRVAVDLHHVRATTLRANVYERNLLADVSEQAAPD